MSVLRVDEPTAVSRLRAWSVTGLWESSRDVRSGMCRMMSRSVASLISSPHRRRHCRFRSCERLSEPKERDRGGVQDRERIVTWGRMRQDKEQGE